MGLKGIPAKGNTPQGMKPRRKKPDLLLPLEALLSIAAWLVISAVTVTITLIITVIYPFHPLLDPKREGIHRLTALWGRMLVWMAPGGRVKIFGMQNIPERGPVIFLSNHQSYSDVPVIYFLREQFKWMADTDLFRIPFFGWSMAMAGYISVQRGDIQSSRRSLEEAKRWLKEGISIFFFPEGTRSHTGAFGRFHLGGFLLAAETQTPVVPVVLVGTRQLLPRGSWIFRLGARPQIHILPPVAPPSSSSGLKEMHPFMREVRSQMWHLYQRELGRLRG